MHRVEDDTGAPSERAGAGSRENNTDTLMTENPRVADAASTEHGEIGSTKPRRLHFDYDCGVVDGCGWLLRED